MIVVTFKGAPSPLVGHVKGITICALARGPSPADAFLDALGRFTIERDGFLFVQPGARVWTAPVLERLRSKDFDVAAYVDRIGSTPTTPRQFDGIGVVSLETILVRPTTGARRLLDRWVQRNAAYPGKEDVNLCIALTETRETSFLFLPPTWRWHAESFIPESDAVVRFGSVQSLPAVTYEPPKPKPVESTALKHVYKKSNFPEVLQSGHFLSWASYGRLNREILFRIANSLAVRIESDSKEAILVDEYTRTKVESFQSTLIGPKAPILRIFGPDHEPQKDRFSICYTLMETDRVHRDMVEKINSRYSELWTCTNWGKSAFVGSGVRIPTRVVPLGINPAIFKPLKKIAFPECRLVSTSKRGNYRSPSGWIALAVGLPSRRKNFEFIAEAIELAFPKKSDVDFVIATTHAPGSWSSRIHDKLANLKTRVWILEGKFTDTQMAEIYSSSDAIVSASLGEGWGLPSHEGAACGKPIIVPRNSANPDVLGEDAWMFEKDGISKCPEAESVSPWYVDMDWPRYGARARRALAELIRTVHSGGREVRERTERLQVRMSRMTWDITAELITNRLIEVQP
jgi:glycosyltransferase involved in cell wall biosynthesis